MARILAHSSWLARSFAFFAIASLVAAGVAVGDPTGGDDPLPGSPCDPPATPGDPLLPPLPEAGIADDAERILFGGFEQWNASADGLAGASEWPTDIAMAAGGEIILVAAGTYAPGVGQDRIVVALDAATADVLWTFKHPTTSHKVRSGLLAVSGDGETAYFALTDWKAFSWASWGDRYNVYALDVRTGTELWRAFPLVEGGSQFDRLLALAATPDGSALVLGGYGAVHRTHENGFGRTDGDMVMWALDPATGETINQRNDGTFGWDALHDVAVTHNGGGFAWTGVRWVQDYYGDPNEPYLASGPDSHASNCSGPHYDEGGGFDDFGSGDAAGWFRTYNGPANQGERGYGIAFSADDRTLYTVGLGNYEHYHGTVADAFFIARDVATGDLLWESIYNGPGNARDQAFNVVATPDGQFVLVTVTFTGVEAQQALALVVLDAATGTVLSVTPWDRSVTAVSPYRLEVSSDGLQAFVTGDFRAADVPGAEGFAVAFDLGGLAALGEAGAAALPLPDGLDLEATACSAMKRAAARPCVMWSREFLAPFTASPFAALATDDASYFVVTNSPTEADVDLHLKAFSPTGLLGGDVPTNVAMPDVPSGPGAPEAPEVPPGAYPRDVAAGPECGTHVARGYGADSSAGTHTRADGATVHAEACADGRADDRATDAFAAAHADGLERCDVRTQWHLTPATEFQAGHVC